MLNQLFNKLVKGKRDIRIRKAVNADVFELISLIKDIRKAYGLPIDLKKKDQDLLSIDFYYKNGKEANWCKSMTGIASGHRQ